MSRERRPALAAPSGPGAVDPELAALQEIIRLAEEDRRRGIRYWFDPELAAALRERVRDLSGDAAAPRVTVTPSRPAPGRTAAIAGFADRPEPRAPHG